MDAWKMPQTTSTILKFKQLAVILISGLILLNSSSSAINTEATNLQKLSRAHLEFALSLFRELASDSNPSDNVVISPHSIASVLSQLWLGAGNRSLTSEQLENVLHYNEGGLSPEQVHEAFRSSLYTLDDPDYKNVVKTANGVFLQAGFPIKSAYESNLKKYYNSSVDEVDFENGEHFARTIINRWVAKQTNGHITKLLETPIPKNTRLLLVNALALRALWNNSFDPTQTITNGYFHQDLNTKMQIPMMTGRFNVLLGGSAALKCRLLELPFRGRRLSMFILLPDYENILRSTQSKRKASSTAATPASLLAKLENSLTAENLKRLFSTLKEEKKVRVKLPKFRVQHSTNLVETLTRLGLTHIFDSHKSDFSGISDSKELYVSSIAHKTMLEIREEGAKAYAVTATEIERTHDVGAKYFEVNRPFLFLIWDYHSGALLFIGRVANPEPLLT